MPNQSFILVVDDNKDAAALLVQLLKIANYQAKPVYSGFEALDLLNSSPADNLPDLILLDLMMPGIDGLEVLRRIKTNQALPFIPVVIITASGITQNRITGLETGADDYLTKPFNQAELIARVRSLLRLKQAHDKQAGLLKEVKTAYDRLNTTSLELEEAEKKKLQMEAMVSTAQAICHEMSQPLTSALITLQLIKQSNQNNQSVLQDFDSVENSLLEARIILDKLRTLTRYETRTFFGDENILDLELSTVQDGKVDPIRENLPNVKPENEE